MKEIYETAYNARFNQQEANIKARILEVKANPDKVDRVVDEFVRAVIQAAEVYKDTIDNPPAPKAKPDIK